MYPFDNDGKGMRSDKNAGEADYTEQSYNEAAYIEQPDTEPSYTEQPQNETDYNTPPHGEPAYGSYNYNETLFSTPPHSELAHGEVAYDNPTYNEQVNIESVYNEQTYREQMYSEPLHNAPVTYSEHPYNASPYNTPVYNEPLDAPQNMYSPGICVNQPYPPPPRINRTSYDAASPRSADARNGVPRERTHRLGGLVRAICLVIVCSLFSGIAAYSVMDFRINRGDFAAPPPVIIGGITDSRPDDDFTTPIVTGGAMLAQDIYDMARTQVVGIFTEAPNMFGIPGLEDAAAPISGTGFIISNDGFILTNYHVIEIAHVYNLPIDVILNDGMSYDAEIIGFEVDNDVAVIKINTQDLNPVVIGNSDNIRVGQTIYAIGNPFGDLVNTMTDGIVSALDRVVSVEGKSIRTFQFSAPVNSGNSGGPIYNIYGEVLGIVTAKVVRGNVEGIGFAIPINDAIAIAAELIEHGYISGRPLIGITAQTVTPAHADYLGWVVGAYIRNVSPDSAAETAGIAVGDIIVGLGDVEVDSMDILRATLREYSAGDTTTITVWREGEILDFTITFDEDMYAGQPPEMRPGVELDSPDPFEDIP